MKQKAAADRRAQRLLKRHLDRVQKKELKLSGSFIVTGADGYTYRIRAAESMNVDRVEDGRVTVRFCTVFKDYSIPIADKMLVQKFMLQSDPEQFLKIANAQPVPQSEAEPATHQSAA